MKDKKKLTIGILCTMICIMAVGYALLAQQLNINGRASIDSTWKIEITNIQEREVTGKALSKVTPTYTSTTANFSVGLTQPGDSITYDIEVSNLGTLDALVDSINVNTENNPAIKYTTSGIANGDKLKATEKATLTVKVEYDSSIISQPAVTTNEITVAINYVQDLGTTGGQTAYQAYSVGDTIEFAGSNWYVIKDSTEDEDYVTLMKEKVLTRDELGEYAFNVNCLKDSEGYWSYPGCTTEGQIVTLDKMSYYYSDTCHWARAYGYTDSYTDPVTSGCSGHNDYEGSKVKELLENSYINTLGTENLKEVEGYKIRLIKAEELKNNLGWSNLDLENGNNPDPPSTVPSWIYSTYYWTMTPYCGSSDVVWHVYRNSYDYYISDYGVWHLFGVRPVINLLKSNI